MIGCNIIMMIVVFGVLWSEMKKFYEKIKLKLQFLQILLLCIQAMLSNDLFA